MRTIALARGLPPLSVMRRLKPKLLEAFQNAADARENDFLQYGHFAGYEPLREVVAESFGVNKKRVFIGNGSMDTLHLFLQFLVSRQEIGAYLCAKEVYDRPIVIAKALGLNTCTADLTEEGLDLEEVQTVVGSSVDRGVVYTIPWFDNPSGILHSPENIRQTAEIAARKNWFVIRDGAYLDLSYFEKPDLMPVSENVIHTFSWSKTITAGNHTGGIIIPEEFAGEFLYFISSWRLSPVLPTQMATYELIRSGDWQSHIERNVIPDGRRRTERFNALMQEHLPESKRRDIRGGHFWGGKIKGLNEQNWDRFVAAAEHDFGLIIPHHGGFMPLVPHRESAGYIRIPLFLEDNEIADPLERIVMGIAGARDAVA